MWTCARVVRIIATGRREMVLPIGTKAARDTDRYIRTVPRTHTRPIRGLWLGKKGRLTPSGIYQMIKDRDNQIGLPEHHPHQLRRTFSQGWLANGGSEGDLMRLAGWKTRAMLTPLIRERCRRTRAGCPPTPFPGDRF